LVTCSLIGVFAGIVRVAGSTEPRANRSCEESSAARDGVADNAKKASEAKMIAAVFDVDI
jgi:hypothetical protein